MDMLHQRETLLQDRTGISSISRGIELDATGSAYAHEIQAAAEAILVINIIDRSAIGFRLGLAEGAFLSPFRLGRTRSWNPEGLISPLVEQLERIRTQFQLNLSQLAAVLRVSRPTLNRWRGGGAMKWGTHIERIRQLDELAHHWASLCEKPMKPSALLYRTEVGSLFELLQAPDLNIEALAKTLERLSCEMGALEHRRATSRIDQMRAAADSRSVAEPSVETQRDRLRQLDSLGLG